MVGHRHLCILVIIFVSLSFASAFEFNGTVRDINGNPLNNTLVNITIYDVNGGFTYVGYNATNTNATGWFNITVSENTDWLYSPVIHHFNGSSIQYIGQSLPHFPEEIMTEISGINFYLREAGTIIINAINQTGSPIGFQYQVKDQRLGYSIAESFSEGTNVSSATIYVPRDRNYSIMIFPDMSMPVSFDWNNFSATENYNLIDGLSDYNFTERTLNKTFNMTMSWARVSGYINTTNTGFNSLGNLTIIPYMLEPGEMSHPEFGAIPYNLSSFFDGTSDWYNLSTGVTNNAGFYNISLPSTVENSEMILLAIAQNGSEYYAGFHNLSLDFSTYNNGAGYTLNFSRMFGMLGNEGVISLEGAGGPGRNVSAKLQTFNIVNESNATLTNIDAHIEATVDYTDYGVKQFTWMVDSTQGSSSSFTLPLLNSTGIEEMNVFAGGGNYEPVRVDLTVPEIIANNNITIRSFNPGDIDGSNVTTDLFIALYTSNATCDVPNPLSSCTVGSSENFNDFNPLEAIMGGGRLSFRMGLPTTGIEVHYVNVDMLASGPPAALFDDSTSESTSGSFESALRFGSNGPTIYDYVLISAPYTEGNSSQTGLNESGDINVSIEIFYDEDWNVIWNTSVNGTSAANLAGNFSHYEEYQTEWGILMGTNNCTDDVSSFNATNPCFVNKTENKVWIRIPHFSGTGPTISGDVITASTSNTNNNGGGSSSSSSGGNSKTLGSQGNPLDSEDLADGYEHLLRPFLPVYIKNNKYGEVHKIELNGIIDDKINITISSDPITLTLGQGEIVKLNLSNNQFYDFQIELIRIVGGLATIELTEIEEPHPDYVQETSDPTITDNNAGNDDVGKKEVTAKGLGSFLKYFIMVLIVVVICVLIYLYIIKPKMSKVDNFSTKKRKKK